MVHINHHHIRVRTIDGWYFATMTAASLDPLHPLEQLAYCAKDHDGRPTT